MNFSGTANLIAFDDIRLTTDPLSFAQGSPVPEPATMGIGLAVSPCLLWRGSAAGNSSRFRRELLSW